MTGIRFTRLQKTLVVIAVVAAGIAAAKVVARLRAPPKFVLATYQELYFQKEMPSIREVRFLNHSLVSIDLGELLCRYQVNQDSEVSNPASRFEVPLSKGTNTLKFECDRASAPLRFSLELEFTPSESYAEAGNSSSGVVELVHSDLPVVPQPYSSVQDWLRTLSPEDVEKARQMLKAKTRTFELTATADKISEISRFLLNVTDNVRGIPSQNMERLSPFQQFLALQDHTEKAWCTTFRNIYGLFANAAGIPTRDVAVMGHMNDVQFSGHVFNESYIAESGSWAFVDLTSGKWLIQSNDKKYLSAADLFSLNLMHQIGSLQAQHYLKGSVETVPYETIADSERRYFNENSYLVYERTSAKPATHLFNPRGTYLGLSPR
jgi:hypothetical protein